MSATWSRKVFPFLNLGLYGLLAPGWDCIDDKPVRNQKSSFPLNRWYFLYRLFFVFYVILEEHFFLSQAIILIATSSVIIPPGLVPSVAISYWNYFVPSGAINSTLLSVRFEFNCRLIVSETILVFVALFFTSSVSFITSTTRLGMLLKDGGCHLTISGKEPYNRLVVLSTRSWIGSPSLYFPYFM